MDAYDDQAMDPAMGGDHESASNMTAAMQQPAPTADGEGWKLQSVSFSPAENGGVVANCSKTKKRPENKDGYRGEDYESKQYAFTTVEEAAAYLMEELSGAEGSGTSGPGMPATTRL